MSDLVLIPLGPLGVLQLTREQYLAALVPLQPVATTPAASDAPELIDGPELARRTNLPVSYVMEQARQGAIPSVKVGKYRRFRPDAVAHLGVAPDQLSAYQQAGTKSLQKKELAKGRYRAATGFSRRDAAVEGGS